MKLCAIYRLRKGKCEILKTKAEKILGKVTRIQYTWRVVCGTQGDGCRKEAKVEQGYDH